MDNLVCGHTDIKIIKLVCEHLISNPDGDYCKVFTGKGKEYGLICYNCAGKYQNIEIANIPFKSICLPCFEQIEKEGFWDNDYGVKGKPEIKTKPSHLFFNHDNFAFEELSGESILKIEASTKSEDIYVLCKSKRLYKINLNHHQCSLLKLPIDFIDELGLQLQFKVSPNEKWAVLSNLFGQYGIVWDLKNGKKVLDLDRNNYHIQHCFFSIAFFEYNDKTYLVHATDWNRLDITDLESGELITYREGTQFDKDKKVPDNYLDYFHCNLIISPDQKWIVDNGWVWHPIGQVVTWSLTEWIENPWESENGSTKKSLCERFYYWDGPLCWINSQHIAIWGFGNDELNLIPAVMIYSVITGELEDWFPGPEGNLYFDKYLYAYSNDKGTTVWNIESGELLHHDNSLKPLTYHPILKQFISIGKDNFFILSSLTGEI